MSARKSFVLIAAFLCGLIPGASWLALAWWADAFSMGGAVVAAVALSTGLLMGAGADYMLTKAKATP